MNKIFKTDIDDIVYDIDWIEYYGECMLDAGIREKNPKALEDGIMALFFNHIKVLTNLVKVYKDVEKTSKLSKAFNTLFDESVELNDKLFQIQDYLFKVWIVNQKGNSELSIFKIIEFYEQNFKKFFSNYDEFNIVVKSRDVWSKINHKEIVPTKKTSKALYLINSEDKNQKMDKNANEPGYKLGKENALNRFNQNKKLSNSSIKIVRKENELENRKKIDDPFKNLNRFAANQIRYENPKSKKDSNSEDEKDTLFQYKYTINRQTQSPVCNLNKKSDSTSKSAEVYDFDFDNENQNRDFNNWEEMEENYWHKTRGKTLHPCANKYQEAPQGRKRNDDLIPNGDSFVEPIQLEF